MSKCSSRVLSRGSGRGLPHYSDVLSVEKAER